MVSEFVEEGLHAAVVPPYSVNVAFHFQEELTSAFILVSIRDALSIFHRYHVTVS